MSAAMGTTARRSPAGAGMALLLGVLGVTTSSASCNDAAPPPTASPIVSPPAANVGDGDLPLYVFVGADGVTTIDGEPILSDAVIAARADTFHTNYPRAVAKVRCEQAALHGRAVRVLDLLRAAGIESISVQLAP